VRHAHRLRALQVRVRGHERALQRLRALDEGLLHLAHGRVEARARVHGPEARGGGHLVVAAPARVQLPRRRRPHARPGEHLVQQPVDERVHVLVGRGRRLARL
jgi:hypothetical protein